MRPGIYTKLIEYFEVRKDYGTIFLRLIIGWRLIDGTQDNVFSWGRMIEFSNFLEQHHVAYPLVAANVSVYAQFTCGILYMTGLFIRPAAIIMINQFYSGFNYSPYWNHISAIVRSLDDAFRIDLLSILRCWKDFFGQLASEP